MTNPTSQRRPNALLDPTRQPDGTVALDCDECYAFLCWVTPPVPPCRVVCGSCRDGGAETLTVGGDGAR